MFFTPTFDCATAQTVWCCVCHSRMATEIVEVFPVPGGPCTRTTGSFELTIASTTFDCDWFRWRFAWPTRSAASVTFNDFGLPFRGNHTSEMKGVLGETRVSLPCRRCRKKSSLARSAFVSSSRPITRTLFIFPSETNSIFLEVLTDVDFPITLWGLP